MHTLAAEDASGADSVSDKSAWMVSAVIPLDCRKAVLRSCDSSFIFGSCKNIRACSIKGGDCDSGSPELPSFSVGVVPSLSRASVAPFGAAFSEIDCSVDDVGGLARCQEGIEGFLVPALFTMVQMQQDLEKRKGNTVHMRRRRRNYCVVDMRWT